MAIELEDGTVILSLPEQVEENKAKVEEVDIKVDNLAARVEAALAGVLHYKGSVATYSDLPADAEIGDVYNVIDTGANYAWTGSEWDELGSVVDLSNCVTLDSAQTITADKTLDDAEVKFSNSSPSVYSIGKEVDQFTIKKDGSPSFLLSSTAAFLKARFAPYIDNTYDLGHSSYKWKDLYLSNALNLGASGILKYDSDISSFTSNSHISPAVHNNYDLGRDAQRWKSVWIANVAHFKNDTGGIDFEIKPDNYGAFVLGGAIRILGNNQNVHPVRDNSQTLGLSNYRWKNIYVSDTISDGTNSVNVADLKALIDYAKAQGWIS